MSNDFESYSDDEIIGLIHADNDEAMDFLLQKYGYIVKREARTVYLIGADADDIAQEGMIGLFKAIRDYEPDKGALFSTFATLCVKRQIKTAIVNSNRKKHAPLNTAISLYAEDASDLDRLMGELDKSGFDDGTNPEEVVIEREERLKRAELINKKLSAYEKKILVLYLGGLSRGEIAVKLDKPEKSVDNALSRIRLKLSLT